MQGEFWVNSQMQEKLNEAAVRDQMELNKLMKKEQIMNASKLELEQQRMRMQEYRQAVKSASYTVVDVREDGSVETKNANALIELPKRPITNFKVDVMVELISADGDQGIYGLRISINGKPEQLFLDAGKMGNPDYFMKKLTAVGGKILVDKNQKRKNILIALWTELYGKCKESLTVPTHSGWMADSVKGYRFVKEGAILWEEVLRRAK